MTQPHEVPLQRASTPVIMPVYRPVANVVPAEVVATPSSTTPLPVPNRGSTRVHFVPVSRKITGEVCGTVGPVKWEPTAQPPLAFAVTADRVPLATGAGLVTAFHARPFQCRISVCGWPLPVLPTAQASFALTTVTADSCPVPVSTFGLVTRDQPAAVPVQHQHLVDAGGPVKPTAQALLLDAAATPARAPVVLKLAAAGRAAPPDAPRPRPDQRRRWPGSPECQPRRPRKWHAEIHAKALPSPPCGSPS